MLIQYFETVFKHIDGNVSRSDDLFNMVSST